MANSIKDEFVVLSPDKKASIEAVDSTMYERLDKNYNGFKGHELISCHEFEQDWSTWEIHPKGDEVVVLLSGQATLLLKLEDGIKAIEMEGQGAYTIVPQNTWHTAKTNVKTSMLFITPGEGTENKVMSFG